MRRCRLAVLAFLLLIGMGSGAVAAQRPGAGTVGNAPLSPGDMVRLMVWQDGSIPVSGEYEVMPDSSLAHPLLREVRVAGVPLLEAEQRLRVYLGRYMNNPYLILVPRYRVFVGGEVGSPGIMTLGSNASVAEAVLLAGVSPERGRMDRVRLIRGGVEQIIDLRRLDSWEARQPIRSGDQIIVERRTRILRDYLVPTVSVLGSITAIITFLDRL
jgi:protein involved in polysaccharide export with SLBB domain